MRRALIAIVLLAGCGDGGSASPPPPPPPPTCVNGGVVCPVGFECSLATSSCLQASGTLRWVLNDACPDGRGIQVRFFDATNGGVWPAEAGQAFITSVEGGFADELLACIPGAKVCYGATPAPQDGGYWGLGIDGTHTCTDCCVICGAGDPPPIDLTCN